MTPEQREEFAAQCALCEAQQELISFVSDEDLQAATVAALWKALEIASEGMSKDALKRLIFGEDHIVDANKMVRPAGWKLVPVEPTQEMCKTAEIDTGVRISDGPAYAAELYRAMLAVAPQQPAPQPLTAKRIREWWASENGLEDMDMAKLDDFTQVVRAIERAHGIKEQP